MSQEKSGADQAPSAAEAEFIKKAKHFLEEPSLLIRIANKLGQPVELLLGKIPEERQKQIHTAVNTALKKGLVTVISSLSKSTNKDFDVAAKQSRAVGLAHSAAAFGIGAVGGFFGAVSLPIELPITTGIMLRSIAATANEFGLDLEDAEIQLECLYVLSLGSSKSQSDDAMDSAYWSSRVAFSGMVREAASFLAQRTAQQVAREIEQGTAPVLIRFITSVAARFEVVVTEKVLAELIPIVGAAGGGLVNAAFADYFSEAAKYHFGLRALETKYGAEAVKTIYGK